MYSDGTSALVQFPRGELVRIYLTTGMAAVTGLQDASGPIDWSDRYRGFVVDAVSPGQSLPVHGPSR